MTDGVLFLDKKKGVSTFSLVTLLRRLLNIRTIGHVGTLDPMAEGLVILLCGKTQTKRAHFFLEHSKRYQAEITLGIETDSYDSEGTLTNTSSIIPSLNEVSHALMSFQGNVLQTPPMFSAKKINGQRLYRLARKGIEVQRSAVEVYLESSLVNYSYPNITLSVYCSKGTYIRSIAHDLGQKLGSFAHLSKLTRTNIGLVSIEESVKQTLIESMDCEKILFDHTQKFNQLYPDYNNLLCFQAS